MDNGLLNGFFDGFLPWFLPGFAKSWVIFGHFGPYFLPFGESFLISRLLEGKSKKVEWLPGGTKVPCFFEALKYLKTFKQHPFETPGGLVFS